MKKKRRSSRRNKDKARIKILLIFLGIFLIGSIFLLNILQKELKKRGRHFPLKEYEIIDLTQQSKLLNMVIDSQLFASGIEKSDFIKEKGEKRDDGSIKWICFYKEIEINNASDFENIRDKIKGAVKALEEKVYCEEDGQLLEIILGFEVKDNNQTKVDSCVLKFIPRDNLAKAKRSFPEKEYKIAIIIDDIGFSKSIAEELMKIDTSLTFSILPFLPHSAEIAEIANKRKFEILLHLPMEPVGYPEIDPGCGALLTNMDKEEILKNIHQSLKSVPFSVGVNNHMGSKMTADIEGMGIILGELKKRNLFFIDSKTCGNSVAYKTARRMGMKTAQRQIFLDDKEDEEYIIKQIELLAQVAKKEGQAIGIGHPHPGTILALSKMVPELKKQGIQIVPASELVN